MENWRKLSQNFHQILLHNKSYVYIFIFAFILLLDVGEIDSLYCIFPSSLFCTYLVRMDFFLGGSSLLDLTSDPSSSHTVAPPTSTESTTSEIASAMLDDELLSLGICLWAWANSVDPDEMLQNAASHQGLHCLPIIQQFLDTTSGSKLYLFKF